MTGRTRIAVAATAAALAATVALLGGALRESTTAGAGGAAPAAVAGELQTGFAAGDTAALVLRLQHELRGRPGDARRLTLLGLAYQQRARETADPAYYAKAAGVLGKALRLEPGDSLATSATASLALSQHDFRRALALGLRARALAPGTARNLGVIGDALVELGRYDQAFDAFDRFAARKPGLASYARVAYARELLGRPGEAIEAMTLALDAAGGRPEPTAWTHVELGKLHFGQGRLAPAARHYRAALAAFPGYVYALDGLAHVEAARGRHQRAVGLARRAVDSVPLPQFVATLGDLLRATGREELAREQYALVGAIERLLRANGVRTDLETALFDVDHGIRLRDSLAGARRAQRERPSIEGDDVLAWALARNGRCGEALRFSERALRLGTRDALKVFHRGMIERCLGRPAAAKRWFRRALATNPHFSLVWSPVARRLAA
ncbi:MAG: tetratricopeptide repeat protein [Gaiellaceae bacterium]